ncbi:MAG: alpha/beta hydrolase [bacterium]|nr:alpha/beta hydrolase [bacterium]
MELTALITAAVFSLSSIPTLMKQGEEIKAQVSPDVSLRLMHWEASGSSLFGMETPTIVILQGRASFIEKHGETIRDFRNLGFDVWAFDWRGHGGSTRLLDNPQKSYVNDYDEYLKDLEKVLSKHVIPAARGPVVLLGSSMGGHIALRYLADKQGKSGVAVAVLAAPMLDIPTKPFPRFVARSLVWLASSTGFGGSYAVGYGDYDPSRFKFEGNKTTHDRRRFERQKETCTQYMHYVTGGPTYAWVEATFRSIKTLLDPETLEHLKTPIFMANSTNDTMVDNALDQKSCAKMPGCTLKTYRAKHNILAETDDVRTQFFSDTLGFLKKALPSFPRWANAKGHPACPKVLTPKQQEEMYKTGGITYKRLRLETGYPLLKKGDQKLNPTLWEKIAYPRSAFVDEGTLICNYRVGFGLNNGAPWTKIDLRAYNFSG